MVGSTRTGLKSRPTGRREVIGFARDEGGMLIVFGLFIFVLMLMVGGLSVDLMRYEADRSRIQNTADRAALAAASLRQDLEPEEVVADYFARAGLSEHLDSTVVDEGLNYRNVRALTTTSVGTFFMPLMGIDELVSAGTGAAEERITNVEIALVLDISGSMQNTPSRIANLKIAADEFIRKILEDDDDNRISISVVPYNGQVNIGPHLTQVFNVTHQHGTPDVYCVDLPPSVYDALVMSSSTPMEQTAWADSFSSASTSNSYQSPQAPNTANVWCPAVANNYVRPLSNDITALRSQIANLQAVGATSIDAGLRWGLTLIDPASRGAVSQLVSLGAVPAHFAGRPFDWDDPEVLKVIVVMSDGEHFAEERINTDYKSGLSPIWRSSGDNTFSIYHASWSGSSKYWVPHRNSGYGEWRSSPWNSGSGVYQLTWVEVWQRLRVKYVAWQLYARALGGTSSGRTSVYNTWVANFRSLASTSAMDARLNQLCTLAKAQNALIFGIAFEAPQHGADVIRACASPNRFYDVDGFEISTAFRQVRSQISSLRLTQ